jgi:hypothetical protein
MSISLDPIVNTNTFGVWKDRTNEIVQALEDVVTIGGATDNREGDITIRGDITSTANLVVDTINAYSPAGDLALNGAVRIDDGLTINNGGSGVGQITFLDDGTITWKVNTSSDHNSIDFIRNDKYMRIDYTEATITGSGLTIHADLMPTTDSIDEGNNNLYYNNERVRAAISVAQGSSITYDSANGVFDFTMPEIPEYGVTASKALARKAVDGGYTFGVNFDGSTIKLNANNALYVPNGAIVGAMSAGTGVSVEANGQISIAQSVATTADVEFESVSANTASLDTSVAIGSWSFAVDSSGNLEFSYDGTVVASISTAGKITAKDDVTAFGTLLSLPIIE